MEEQLALVSDELPTQPPPTKLASVTLVPKPARLPSLEHAPGAARELSAARSLDQRRAAETIPPLDVDYALE